MKNQLDPISKFLKTNSGEYTAKEIADGIKALELDFTNTYTESFVKHTLKTGDGVANIKFIHSREITEGDFNYEAWTYRKGCNSKDLDFSRRPDNKPSRADLIADLTNILETLVAGAKEARDVDDELDLHKWYKHTSEAYSHSVHSSIGKLTAIIAMAKGADSGQYLEDVQNRINADRTKSAKA